MNNNFLLGCLGALMFEGFRLRKLKNNNILKWRINYLNHILCTAPLIIVVGVIAMVSEPMTKYMAFYIGISIPALITIVNEQ